MTAQLGQHGAGFVSAANAYDAQDAEAAAVLNPREATSTGRRGSNDVFKCLLAGHSKPHRKYHDLDHLRTVLAPLDEIRSAGVDFDHEAATLAA